MGLSFSCPLSNSHDLENQIQSVVVKSVSFGDNDEVKTHVRSVSFNGRDSEPTILRSLGSGEMVVEGSISFKRRKTDTMISITPCSLHKGTSSSMELVNDEIKQMDSQSPKKVKQSPTADLGNSKNEAAVKLQKVYKSFRTRRKLADCAVVLAEQSIFPGQTWWTLLDSVELEQTSISFFNINKPDTASSRWSRAKMKAAKVGKGLSKNEKARKLALQHWLEAIDPRHRYGHNLQFYFLKWRSCQSKEPFFYWLDIGEGKEVNLVEVCPRKKLQYQCIKYLGPEEREAYEVVVDDGKFLYKQTEQVLETASKPEDAKWIFVLSTSGNLYVGKKIKGEFQHSSFLAGGATSAAGRLVVQNGILKAVWAHSGHYKPTEENFSDFISFLNDNNVDLTSVKMSPEDDEQGSLYKKKSSLVRCFSEENLTKNISCSEEDEMTAACMSPERINEMEEENLDCEQKENAEVANEEDEMKSFQLGKQLSGKWISGVGPRIEIVKEYPSKMKFRALELVNLSPRGSTKPESHFCLSSDRPKLSLASSWGKCNTFQACIQDGMKQPSPLRKSTSIP